MAMKTVICLSFIVLKNFLQTCVRAATRGGGKRGQRPPKQNSPPNCPVYPPKLSLPVQQFQDGGFYWGKPTEISEKSRPYRLNDLFLYQQRTW